MQTAEERGIRASEEALLSTALESIRELNTRALALLQRLADQSGSDLPPTLATLAPRLRRLEPASILVASRQPFLLIDFLFGRPDLLNNLLAQAPARLRFPSPPSFLPAPDARALARGALVLAQGICRNHPVHAGPLLGLDPALRLPIAQATMEAMEHLAEEHSHQLRFRWENRTDFWLNLLSLPETNDPQATHELRMHGIRLLAADLKRRSAHGR